jgi:hypothetical protein
VPALPAAPPPRRRYGCVMAAMLHESLVTIGA